MTTTEYVTWLQGDPLYRGDDLETAVRTWDGATYNRDDRPAGGITVQTWADGLMVRDGWILHVTDDGRIFLNPRLTERSVQ